MRRSSMPCASLPRKGGDSIPSRPRTSASSTNSSGKGGNGPIRKGRPAPRANTFGDAVVATIEVYERVGDVADDVAVQLVTRCGTSIREVEVLDHGSGTRIRHGVLVTACRTLRGVVADHGRGTDGSSGRVGGGRSWLGSSRCSTSPLLGHFVGTLGASPQRKVHRAHPSQGSDDLPLTCLTTLRSSWGMGASSWKAHPLPPVLRSSRCPQFDQTGRPAKRRGESCFVTRGSCEHVGSLHAGHDGCRRVGGIDAR